MNAETLPSIFHQQAERLADQTVLQVKREGAYHDVSWSELAAHVRSLAAGLRARGVQPGDRVGILSENRQEWIEADFAILSLGAITVALHAPLTPAQVREQFRDSAPRVVFASTAEQRDKLRSVRADLPSVQHLFTFEESAADGSDVEPLSALTVAGRESGVESDRSPSPHDLAAIIYTSGTTGESKGVMLTHHNFVSNLRAMEAHYPVRGVEIAFVWLPLSHVYARLVDLYWMIATGRVIALAESVDTLIQNLQEVRPHYMSAVPRIHQKLAALARPAFEAGNREALRDLYGGRIRWVSSGGAALPPDVARFYWEAGVPIYQGYGLTETSPVISFSYEGHNKIGASGVPLPGVEVKIAEDGEILTRGPHVMKGYWNRPEATARAIDADGWFHTGDIGFLDEEGFLFITDRKKEIIVTAYGKNIAPQQVEGLLCYDPYVEQAMVYGDDRPYLVALIVPARQALEAWAEENGLRGVAWADLLAHPAVQALYAERVTHALRDLSSYEQVRKFVLLPEPFSYAKGEMTLTAKLRRRQIAERHQAALESLYCD